LSKPNPTPTLELALAAGYCIVSRSGLIATRLDREDWSQHLASKFPKPNERWLKHDRVNADYYRRCISKDKIIVPRSWLELMPNSSDGPTEFKPVTP
jgi:hypothetical protein